MTATPDEMKAAAPTPCGGITPSSIREWAAAFGVLDGGGTARTLSQIAAVLEASQYEIAALRAEVARLSAPNVPMSPLEVELQDMTAERDTYRAEVEALRARIAAATEPEAVERALVRWYEDESWSGAASESGSSDPMLDWANEVRRDMRAALLAALGGPDGQ